MDLRFIHPFTSIIAGPSRCEKTIFIKCFLENVNFICDTRFNRIIWCYDEWQPAYQIHSCKIEFLQGLPELSNFSGTQPELIIIDDLMREADSRVVDIFTKGSHHRNLSVFFLTQNLFHQGKGQRDISLNAHYIILFKNPRDKAQIRYLARQIYPENPKFIEEAYRDATNIPHGYLFIDLKQTTPDIYRFRTSIFPKDDKHFAYVDKKLKYKDKGTNYFPII